MLTTLPPILGQALSISPQVTARRTMKQALNTDLTFTHPSTKKAHSSTVWSFSKAWMSSTAIPTSSENLKNSVIFYIRKKSSIPTLTAGAAKNRLSSGQRNNGSSHWSLTDSDRKPSKKSTGSNGIPPGGETESITWCRFGLTGVFHDRGHGAFRLPSFIAKNAGNLTGVKKHSGRLSRR